MPVKGGSKRTKYAGRNTFARQNRQATALSAVWVHHMIDAQRDQLLLQLYSSVLQPHTIPAVLDALDGFLDSDGIHLLGWHQTHNAATLSMATQRIIDAQHAYDAEARAIDPRMDAGLKQPIGTIFACQQHFDDRFVSRDCFYQEYLLPLAGMRYIMGSRIHSHSGEDVFIVFNHERGRRPFSTTQLQQFQQLIPHLGNWFAQLRQTEALRAAAWAGEQGLAALEQGVILLGHIGQLLYVNPVAERWLQQSPWRSAAAWLRQRPLEEALLRTRRQRLATTLPLVLPQGQFVLHMLPVPQEGFQPAIGQADQGSGRAGHALNLHPCGDILLLIRPRHRQQQPSAANLAALFDLSPAESRLAQALAGGLSAEGYAQQQQLSLATVRSQIRAILMKSGEDNLQSLLRLLAALPAI